MEVSNRLAAIIRKLEEKFFCVAGRHLALSSLYSVTLGFLRGRLPIFVLMVTRPAVYPVSGASQVL